MDFLRGVTSLAEGLSCALWWGHGNLGGDPAAPLPEPGRGYPEQQFSALYFEYHYLFLFPWSQLSPAPFLEPAAFLLEVRQG